ncbi:hypothetical protein ACG7TL_002290 [Trametes sanguinea]
MAYPTLKTMSVSTASERDPLLRTVSSASLGDKRPSRAGPMEISTSTRRGILAGIWAATFLSLGGIGGGGIFTTATIITSDMYTLRTWRPELKDISSNLGMGLGGPLGGFIADRLGWRWAFLIQIPLFVLSFTLTSINLHYVTPGRSKSTREVLKRIDYGGSATLLISVLSILFFLSTRYSEELPWSAPTVYVPLALAVCFALLFVYVELRIAPEPILAPFLLREKIPVLIGISNFLVAVSNFTVMYNFPTWFQTVMLTSASEAGAHLIPNGISVSCGSLFAGWYMHRTGKYKKLSLIFGIFPFVAATLMALMREDSPPIQQWLSIVLGLDSSFEESSILNDELHNRIHGPGAEETISKIRHSSTLVAKLPQDLQRAARDSYALSLRAVFIMAAVSTLLAYIVRLPIPDKPLDQPRPRSRSINELPNPHPANPAELAEEIRESVASPEPAVELSDEDTDEQTERGEDNEEEGRGVPIRTRAPRRRRLSTYESSEGVLDLEDPEIGGSARR